MTAAPASAVRSNHNPQRMMGRSKDTADPPITEEREMIPPESGTKHARFRDGWTTSLRAGVERRRDVGSLFRFHDFVERALPSLEHRHDLADDVLPEGLGRH